MPFEVSSAEREMAIRLADSGKQLQGLAANQPVYFIDVEVLRDKPESTDQEAEGIRQLLVIHYAAADDAAILTRVDPANESVISVELIPHLPVRLSQEEFTIATELALAHPRVAKALEGQEYEIGAQLSRTFDREDPQFGHRVVFLLFKTPQGYLDDPVVIVDITAQKVMVEPGMRGRSQ